MIDGGIFRSRVGDQVIDYDNVRRLFCIVKQSGPYKYDVNCVDPAEEWLGWKEFNVVFDAKLYQKDWVCAHTQLQDDSVTSHQFQDSCVQCEVQFQDAAVHCQAEDFQQICLTVTLKKVLGGQACHGESYYSSQEFRQRLPKRILVDTTFCDPLRRRIYVSRRGTKSYEVLVL